MSLPKFFIKSALNSDGVDRLFGTPETPPPVQASWLRDRRDVYLKSGHSLFRGKWIRRADDWGFVYAPWCRSRLPAHETEVEYIGEDWGRRAALALDPTITWTPRKFRVARGRDRKLCGFCASAVSPAQPDHHWAPPDVVVCDACYFSYVANRSLAFVPGMTESAEAHLALCGSAAPSPFSSDSPHFH